MPCLITALMRSAIKKTTKKANNKISKNKNFAAKTHYLNLEAHLVTKSKCNRIKP